MNKNSHVVIIGNDLSELDKKLNNIDIKTLNNTNVIDEDDIIVFVNQKSNVIKEYSIFNNKNIIVNINDRNSFIFVDVGINHLVIDNKYNTIMIGSIINNVCTCPPNYFHNLNTNDIISFVNVDGCDELYNIEFKIEVISPTSFILLESNIDTTNFRNATCVLVNKSYYISHKKFTQYELLDNNNINIIPVLNIFTHIVISEIIKMRTHINMSINQFWYWKNELTMSYYNNREIIKNKHIALFSDNKYIYDILLSLGCTNIHYYNDISQKNILPKRLHAIIEVSKNNKLKHYIDEYSFQNDVPYFSGINNELYSESYSESYYESYSIVPYITNTLFDMYKPKEKQTYPMCVIKSFPINMEQTIIWAKEHFENVVENITTYEECVFKAFDMFYYYYNKEIQDILELFPPNHMINESGKEIYYWSNGKRCPHIIELDMDYVGITSKIIAYAYNISIDNNILNITKYDSSMSKKNYKLMPINNNALYNEYIDIASKLRASNYNIYVPNNNIQSNIYNDLLLYDSVIIEMLKYFLIKGKKTYHSIQYDLSKDIMIYNNIPCANNIIISGTNFNKWTKFRYNDDSTINEFKSVYDKQFNVDITIIIYNNIILYSDVLDSNNLNKKISDVIKEKNNNVNFQSDNIVISLACDDDDIILPDIIFSLDL